ncbi:preprotein translocase subunit YajC [Streptomyces sp. TRM 70361]|uniref:preprotein translocase subunit YajC n=1 Tax=Streptomyces sp. TRM 70361 TaxID=3116553 RepID=UPI002E7C4BBF|nr:preprotein translocase subunit YajC [Streptomyces sp. TRM 70361]MEE1939059.1 preprotein translocase subunit YajC [Streptomyces sp. TRM 70361]
MDIGLLFPFIILIGAMFLMTRSAKKKQQQAAQMRDQVQPGTGVRTIGGMYALVKEVHADTVLLEVAPGVHAVYAKNAVGAVLEADEYDRIVNGDPEPEDDAPAVPDDASSLTADGADGPNLSKTGGTPAGDPVVAPVDDAEPEDAQAKDARRDGDADSR